MSNVYYKIQADDDVMTIPEWEESVEQGVFIDYDGFGYFADDNTGVAYDEMDVYPSDIGTPKYNEERRHWTHIVWFNR